MIKKGFELFEKRYDCSKKIYPFQGHYRKEIFEEIWNNIIIIPFLHTTDSVKEGINDYRIYIDLGPSEQTEILDSINIITFKLNKIFNEIFQILSMLYNANYFDYFNVNINTENYSEKMDNSELSKIINKYESIYKEEIHIINIIDLDIGDIMEIYLYGYMLFESSFNLFFFIFIKYLRKRRNKRY